MNPLYYNPAYVGEANDLRFGINYRNLWLNVPGVKFPGPLSTYNFYADKQFRNALIGGLGVIVHQNYKGEGFLRHTGAGLLYSWHMADKRNKFHMYLGTKIYFNQLKIDWDKLVFSDQVDPERGYLNSPSSFHQNMSSDGVRNYADLDAGVVFKLLALKNWANEVSFSVAHLLRPDVSLTQTEYVLPIKYVAMYNTSFPLKKGKLYLNPKVLFEMQDKFRAFTYGFNIYVTKRYSVGHQSQYTKPLYLGFYFRNPKYNELKNTKSFIAVIGHTGAFGQKNTRYQVGASYDFTIGGLNMSTYGAVEISATVVIATRTRGKVTRCPEFSGGNPLSPVN